MTEVEHRGAKWLREGARLLQDLCPECGSPLFDRRGEIWCPGCNKKLLTAEGRSALTKITRPALLATLEETIHNVLWRLEKQIRRENDPVRLQQLVTSVYFLLQNLETIERLKEKAGG